ncbi:MAG TPA: Calx-beta domain-containing protein [Verrucomicrobiae bacterium]|nr:Calx-beta domain-containing protein [Verrucomicrobiae bacterium]
MKLKHHLQAALLLTAGSLTTLAADVEGYLVVKGQQFKQQSAGAPSSLPADLPYHFFATVSPADTGAITAARITLPNQQVRSLTNADDSFELQQSFSSKQQLDAAFRPGTYTLAIVTASSGTNTSAVRLLRDAYPPTPRVPNWTDLQSIEPGFPVTVTWDPITNATPQDAIMLEISDPATGDVVFSTPDVLDPSVLAGTNASCVVPSLAPNHTYEGRLIFVRGVDSNTNNPAVPNIAGFYSETVFPLATLAQPNVAAGRVQFTASNVNVAENAGSALLSITRNGSEGAISLNVASANGTALNGADYTAASVALTLQPGVTQTNVLIPVLDDFLLEGSETFTVALSSLSGGALLGNRSNAVVTILDNENRANGTFQFSRPSFTGLEKGKPLAVSVRRIGGTTGTATVNFYTLNGTATGGLDYNATNGTLTFGPKVVAQNILLSMRDDFIDEADETLSVVLDQPSTGAALGTPAVAGVTIKDDDLGGTIQLAGPAVTVNENTNLLLFTVKRIGGTASNVTVQFATANGTATAGSDYAATSGILAFNQGETAKTIPVTLLGDFQAEANETFSLRIFNPSGGAKLGGITNTTCTIADDENSVSIGNATYTVTEGGPALVVTVTRSGALGSAVSVNYATFNGTATAGSDFTATSGTLQFPAKTATRTITVPILNDTIVEGAENFEVRLSTPGGGVQIGSTSTTVVTINDNDTAGSFKFSASSYTGKEGAKANVIVQRVGGTSSGVTVQFTTSNGSAATGDYVNASQTLTFAANEASKTVQITLNSDSTTEGTETVNLSLSNPTGSATLGTPSTATLSISNVAPAGGGGGGGGGGGAVTLTAPGMKANASLGGAFTAAHVHGALVANILTITGFDTGLKTRTITITLSVPPGTTGTVPMNSGGSFFGFANTAINTSTFCSTTKTFNSVSPSTGTMNIVEWDTVNKRFKATFSFTARGVDSGTTCPGQTPGGGAVPTERPSITAGQVWVNYL